MASAYKEIIDKFKPEFDKAVSFLDRELAPVRTGRASPSLVENVVVECFGKVFPLKQLAAISTPEARQILIEPWDRSYIEGIVAALQKTGVGVNAVVDKESVRINIPSLTEDYRKNLHRLIAEKQEEARKVIRKWRDEAWSEVQVKSREGNIREDDKFKAKDDLQKLVDDYNKKIEEAGDKKKKEISN